MCGRLFERNIDTTIAAAMRLGGRPGRKMWQCVHEVLVATKLGARFECHAALAHEVPTLARGKRLRQGVSRFVAGHARGKVAGLQPAGLKLPLRAVAFGAHEIAANWCPPAAFGRERQRLDAHALVRKFHQIE